MSNEILFDVQQGIATLRFNRPQARNALNWAAQEQFVSSIAGIAQDDAIRVLILTGSNGDTSSESAFVAGGDLKELAQGDFQANGQRLSRLMSGALAQMARLPIPVIAAVNGHAVGGGCEILLACDLRLAAPHARLNFAQVRLGLTTGWGGAARLSKLVGRSRATEILLRGRVLSAQEAYRLGLLHAVVKEGEDVLQLAHTWAGEMASFAPEALAAMKQLLYAADDASEQHVAQLERRLFNQLWGRPAHREALERFLGKGQSTIEE